MAVTATQAERSDGPEVPGRDSGARDLFARLDAVDAWIATYDPGRYSAEDGAEVLDRLTRHERVVTAARTLTAARVAEGNLHVRTGHRSAAELLAAQTGESLGEAKGLIRLGQQLADQPDLEDSFRQGKLSRRRASLVSEAARINPGREADLVRTAENDTLPGLKDRCQRAKAQGRSAEDEASHARRLHADRRCRSFTDDDGAFCLQAVLAPQAGARVLSALEAQADRHFEQARRTGAFETADAYRADALVALLTGTGILGRKGAPHPATGDRVPDPRAQLVIRADLDALRRGRTEGDELCEVPGVGPVPVETAIAQLGAALTHLVITDGVDVTTVYSPGRHLPRSIRAALLERDSRCVVPGCDARLGLENDHWVTDYAKGGPTTLANLARLCHRHHQLRTHQGFQLLGGPGKWQWVPPETPVVPKRATRKRKARAPEPPPPFARRPVRRQEE